MSSTHRLAPMPEPRPVDRPQAGPARAAGFRPLRRQLVVAALGLPWLALGLGVRRAGAQEGAIKIGQSIAFTGSQGVSGTAIYQGAKAGFAAINARGGVNGKSIELLAQDDGYEAPKALANAERFLADREIFALFACMGTPTVAAMLPKVLDSGIPFFAPFTGSQVSRIKNARSVFNIRASYANEVEKQVQHLATIGIQRIGIVYQNNSFGKEVLAAAQRAMSDYKLPEAHTVAMDAGDAADAASAAAKLAASHPDAIVVGVAGQPMLEFVKATRAIKRGVALYALSVMGTAATIKALGADGVGMTISQVVPLPSNRIASVVRDFQLAWQAAGASAEPSHLALEGYINARVFAEALARAGRNPTRAAFVDASWGLKRWDLGGFEINASSSEQSASHFVELTLVAHDGRFVR